MACRASGELIVLVLPVLSFLLFVALAAVLVQRFRTTRNTGYLILGIPLVLWPLLSAPLKWFLDIQIDRHVEGEQMLWPLSLFGEMTVGSTVAVVIYTSNVIRLALLVLGFLWLARREPSSADAGVPQDASDPAIGASNAESTSGVGR